MRVRLTQNTTVRHPSGAVLAVSDEEAARLVAFNLAVLVEEKEEEKPRKKRAAKRGKTVEE